MEPQNKLPLVKNPNADQNKEIDLAISDAIKKKNLIAIQKLLGSQKPLSELHVVRICKAFPGQVDTVCINHPEIAKNCLRNIQKNEMRNLQKIIPLLIEKGVDINSLGDDGLSIFQRACKEGMVGVVEALLKASSNASHQRLVTDPTQNRQATSEIEKENGITHANTIESLLELQSLGQKKTALHLAIRAKQHQVVDLLLRWYPPKLLLDKIHFTPLHEAVLTDDKQMIQKIIDWCGPDLLNTQDQLGRTPLFFAGAIRSHKATRLLFKAGADGTIPDKQGDTLLHQQATSSFHPEIAYLAIKNGCDIERRNKLGNTPLLCAGIQGNFHFIDLLRKHGANVDVKNKNRNTFLDLAERCGRIPKALLSANYEEAIESKNHKGATPLLQIAQTGNVVSARYLLAQGANPNIRTKDGRTFLHYAITNRIPKMIKVALNAGSAIEAKDSYGRTPLLLAALKGKKGAVEYLLKKGADIKATSKAKFTFLHYAAQKNRTELITIGVDAGCPIDAKNNKGRTALVVAALNENFEVVEALLNAGARADIPDANGFTFLDYVIRTGKTELLEKLLLMKAVDFNKKNPHGSTPIAYAANIGRLDAIELLLKHHPSKKIDDLKSEVVRAYLYDGANGKNLEWNTVNGSYLNARNQHGDTPLLLAAKRYHMEAVNWMISAGAELNVSNNAQETCAHIAAETNNLAIISQLAMHNVDLWAQDQYGDTPFILAATANAEKVLNFFLSNFSRDPEMFLDYWGQAIARAKLSDKPTVETRYLLHAIRNAVRICKDTMIVTDKIIFLRALEALLDIANDKQQTAIQKLIFFLQRAKALITPEAEKTLRALRDINGLFEKYIDKFSLEKLNGTSLQKEVQQLTVRLFKEERIFTQRASKNESLDNIIKTALYEGTCTGEAVGSCLIGGRLKIKQHVRDAIALQLLEIVRHDVENPNVKFPEVTTKDYLKDLYTTYLTGYGGNTSGMEEIAELQSLKERLQKSTESEVLLCIQPMLKSESGHVVSILKKNGIFYLFDCLDSNKDHTFQTARFEAIIRRMYQNWDWYFCKDTEGGKITYKVLRE